MELTRRDAMAALAALGASGGVALGVRRAGDERGDRENGLERDDEPSGDDFPDDEVVHEVMRAVAGVVYPGSVSGVDAFVDGFLEGRLDGSAHDEGIRAAVDDVDTAAQSWYDNPIADLSVADREAVLRELGADTAEENPRGTTAERVRYYVVNELLMALYASPTGGELAGIENPQGHPGGAESYTRGPL